MVRADYSETMQAKADRVAKTLHVVEHVFKGNERMETCPAKNRIQPQAAAMHEKLVMRERLYFLSNSITNYSSLRVFSPSYA